MLTSRAIPIAVSLEHRHTNEALLIQVICDGSYREMRKAVRAIHGSQWAIADSWEV